MEADAPKINGWKWATLILAALLLMLLACLLGGFWGGIFGFAFGRQVSDARSYDTLPAPPLSQAPDSWYWSPDAPEWMPMVERPWLGVYFEMVEEGALITEVVPDSPAEGAGLQADDVIVALDAAEVTVDNPLDACMLAYAPGDRVKLTYLRDGDERDVRVELGTRPVDETPYTLPDEFWYGTPPSNGG